MKVIPQSGANRVVEAGKRECPSRLPHLHGDPSSIDIEKQKEHDRGVHPVSRETKRKKESASEVRKKKKKKKVKRGGNKNDWSDFMARAVGFRFPKTALFPGERLGLQARDDEMKLCSIGDYIGGTPTHRKIERDCPRRGLRRRRDARKGTSFASRFIFIVFLLLS